VRVIIAQNYSLRDIDDRCTMGEYPRHHLWGADALREAGHDVVTLGSPAMGALHRLTQLTRSRFGNLSRQWLLRQTAALHDADVIVCAEVRFARSVSLLRRLKTVRTPLVGVVHPYEARGRLDRWAFRGFDQLLTLSSKAAQRMDVPSVVTEWGPDLSFAGYQPIRGDKVVTAGRTHRDAAMLASAAAAAKVPLVAHSGSTPFKQLLADLCSSIAVAIPLIRTDGCFGITELNDALASGKPVLMTRNTYIDIDLEGVGCGRWIERGDADGWRTALERLKAEPDEAEAMGARGRAFAEKSWNYARFGRSLVASVAAATQ
jgi:hypothetical protein